MKNLFSVMIVLCLGLTISAQTQLTVMDFYQGEATVGDPQALIGPFCSITDGTLQQAPDQSNGIFSDIGCDICGPGTQTVAEAFIASQDGNIVDLCFAGGYFPGNTNLPDNFQVVYYDDNAGIPGNIIAGPMPLTVNNKVDTGIDIFGVDEYGYQASHAPVAVTMGTTYWIELINDTGLGTDDWFWEAAMSDAVNGTIGNAFDFQFPGVNWNLSLLDDLALAVGYEQIMEPIPTMGEWGLIILGISMLIIGVVAVRIFGRKLAKA